jgi:hypothetical protein
LGDYVRLRQNVQWKKICVESNDQYVVFADIVNKITRSSGKVSTNHVKIIGFAYIIFEETLDFKAQFIHTLTNALPLI